jgi:hypothetical protein
MNRGMKIFLVETGTPRDYSPRGDGVGQNFSPTEFTGTGAGKISTRGDGDGELTPDGEFPVAIPMWVCR